ncbi:hypothetical protein ACFO4O_04275 [Glaciecola siphonariae]|uniref:TMhelix containing protein n=1 Tax=Glaciecola siphonariae TaxID=521012 RepID=A0ABV9LTP4_9ALTE
MELILELLGSAGFGGLLGGVFGYLNKREENKVIDRKLSHEKDMLEANTRSKIELADKGIELEEIKGRVSVNKTEALAFRASQVTNEIGNTIKACVRPIILAVLMYMTWRLIIALEQLTGGIINMPSTDAFALYKIVVLMVTSLTAMAVGWYFAQRSSKQFDKLIDKWG